MLQIRQRGQVPSRAGHTLTIGQAAFPDRPAPTAVTLRALALVCHTLGDLQTQPKVPLTPAADRAVDIPCQRRSARTRSPCGATSASLGRPQGYSSAGCCSCQRRAAASALAERRSPGRGGVDGPSAPAAGGGSGSTGWDSSQRRAAASALADRRGGSLPRLPSSSEPERVMPFLPSLTSSVHGLASGGPSVGSPLCVVLGHCRVKRRIRRTAGFPQCRCAGLRTRPRSCCGWAQKAREQGWTST